MLPKAALEHAIYTWKEHGTGDDSMENLHHWRDAESYTCETAHELLREFYCPELFNLAIRESKAAVRSHLDKYWDPIFAAGVDGVYQADYCPCNPDGDYLCVNMDGLNQLSQAMEEVPEKRKVWHPGTDGQVLNLMIHPSMYCLKHGSTLKFDTPLSSNPLDSLGKMGSGNPLPVKTEVEKSIIRSMRKYEPDPFQWLPAEFRIEGGSLSDKGRALAEKWELPKVVIESYINGLHPRNKDAYLCIAGIFERFTLLFQRVLTDLTNVRPERSLDGYGASTWYKEVPGSCKQTVITTDRHLGDTDDEDGEEQAEDDDGEPVMPQRTIYHPAIPEKPNRFPKQKVYDLNGQTWQVIVKIASIHSLILPKPVPAHTQMFLRHPSLSVRLPI
ncbi:hypothetical protein HDV00_007329, partial [Rhizophlyctis rosea]